MKQKKGKPCKTSKLRPTLGSVDADYQCPVQEISPAYALKEADLNRLELKSVTVQ